MEQAHSKNSLANAANATSNSKSKTDSLSTIISIRNNFVAGALGLSTAFALMHPLDTLKTRMQAQVSSSGKGTSLTLKTLFSFETLRLLSRGFTASVLGAGPQGGLRLSSYELTKSILLKPRSTSKSNKKQPLIDPILASGISAVVGDFASSIVKVPREVITARLQASTLSQPSSVANGSNASPTRAVNVIKNIIKEEGPLGFFRGFWSTTARDAPFMVILFCTYESFKQYQHHFPTPTLPTTKLSSNSIASKKSQITTLKSTLFGGISGALAGFLTTPFDVIKTTVMTSTSLSTQTTTISSPTSKYSSAASSAPSKPQRGIWTVGKNLVMRRGAGVLFTGAGPRSLWWFGICSVFFPLYEWGKVGMNAWSVR